MDYRDAAGALLDLPEDVLVSLPPNVAVVEIGSYHGRSTALIASVVKAVAPGRQVVAIDPHEVTHAGDLVAVRRSAGATGLT
jgi:predicted O-methyltransferase YrrM